LLAEGLDVSAGGYKILPRTVVAPCGDLKLLVLLPRTYVLGYCWPPLPGLVRGSAVLLLYRRAIEGLSPTRATL